LTAAQSAAAEPAAAPTEATTAPEPAAAAKSAAPARWPGIWFAVVGSASESNLLGAITLVVVQDPWSRKIHVLFGRRDSGSACPRKKRAHGHASGHSIQAAHVHHSCLAVL
jgi:hypothetical protein